MNRLFAFAAALAFAVAFPGAFPGAAFAQPKAPKPPKPSPPSAASAASSAAVPPASTAAAPHVGAIGYLAGAIAQALGQVPAGALVAVSPLASDIPAPKGEELAIRVATQVAGRLAVAHPHPQPATLAIARGVSGRAASLVYVQLEIAKGELRATADLYPVISNGWERLRNPVPGPQAHAFAAAPLDAEVRTFLQPIALERASVHKVKHEESDVLAIGCGDLDADGGLEIVIATKSRVVVGKLRAGKLEIQKAAPWRDLASRAPVPVREALASVIVAPRSHPGEVLLGTTDRSGIVLDGTLTARRPLTGLPIPGGDGEACASPSPESGSFDGPGIACAPPPKGDPATVLDLPVPRYDAVAEALVVAANGTVTEVVAAREPMGKLRLRRTDANGKSHEAPIDGAGAQVAIADLDLDGLPEIAFSADLPESDALIVWTWKANGLAQRLRIPTKEPIRAIATCPPEERGVPGLLAVVGSEVWLVR